jgi:hypothetical protein
MTKFLFVTGLAKSSLAGRVMRLCGAEDDGVQTAIARLVAVQLTVVRIMYERMTPNDYQTFRQCVTFGLDLIKRALDAPNPSAVVKQFGDTDALKQMSREVQ